MQRITDIKTLGKLVRHTRKVQNLTQEQLAAASGVGIRFFGFQCRAVPAFGFSFVVSPECR